MKFLIEQEGIISIHSLKGSSRHIKPPLLEIIPTFWPYDFEFVVSLHAKQQTLQQ